MTFEPDYRRVVEADEREFLARYCRFRRERTGARRRGGEAQACEAASGPRRKGQRCSWARI